MKALVLGSAECLYRDREDVFWAKPDRTYAVNFAGLLCPDADVWVTGHAELVGEYQRRFRAWHRPLPEMVAGLHNKNRIKDAPHIDRFAEMFEGEVKRFDSSLLAVKVALDDGAGKVILCGVPLSIGSNFNGTTPLRHSYAPYRKAWEEAFPHIDGRVKSCSGFTRDLLGAPTREWWNDEP
jgi:hypothetical protein